ncbi:MAG TPA: dihydroneopterin aldolase [Anseongella sp.]|nr:dihydroneopterin aldolase [Anseongella sp.]
MAHPSERHRIVLEEIEVLAPVGYYTEEQKIGTLFLVNLEIETDFSGTEAEDELHRTVNYEDMVAVIRTEMAAPAKLIEHAAHRIKNGIIRLSPSVSYIRLELKKQRPVLALRTASANIIIEYRK